MTIERREFALEEAEFRAEGRRLQGVVMPYGRESDRTPMGRERFAPGAFEGRAGDVVLNFGHDSGRPLSRSGAGLTLTHTPEALRMSAELPNTRDADDALELVRAKVMRGLSVEFVAREERMEGGVRVVEAAQLVGVAVVTRPAYLEAEVQAREAEPEPGPEIVTDWAFYA